MTTGWKWIDSNGNEYKSIVDACRALDQDPTLTFQFSELTMGGTKLQDATHVVKEALDHWRNQVRDFGKT